MSDTAIRVENLSKQYRIGQTTGYGTLRDAIMARVRRPATPPALPASGDKHHIWALKDVAFEVQRGEAVGVIGRNGSGKSTLLKILSRITAPTAGRATIRGRVGSLLEVGTGFHPELTGRENVYLNGAIIGMSRVEVRQRFDEIVAFAEIERFLDTPVKRYSSGMYVRLAFAVAAHLDPEVLLIDEVLAVGDAEFQRKCLGRMGRATQEGRTVLFVSHNMMAIRELCSKAILLVNGQIVEDAPAEGAIAHYLSQGSPPGASEVDVSHASLRRNSLPDSQFRWTRAAIVNSGGLATTAVRLGEPFDIILEGVAKSAVGNLRVGFSVDSPLGITMFNSFQIDDGLPSSIPAGKVGYRIRIEPNVLAPGPYDLGLGANGEGVIDWLPLAVRFDVLPTGERAGGARHLRHSGMLHYPCRWSLLQKESCTDCHHDRTDSRKI